MNKLLVHCDEDSPIKRIFLRSSLFGFRVCLLLLLAVVLMVSDQRIRHFHRVRQIFSVIVLPLQEIVDTPIQWVHHITTGVMAQRHLLEENARLKANQVLLQSKLQKLIALEHENAQLKELLKSSSRVAGNVKIAQLLAVNLDPTVQQIIVDKGYRDHLYRGQPVLDAYGVIGEVVDVAPLTSKVLLLTDSRFSIPVKDQRNGLRAIATGTGATQQLALLHINNKDTVKVGDVFVTSGLGLHFPIGYPVGVVSSVQQIAGERFIKVTLTPLAHFNQTQKIILVWPSEASLTKAVRIELDKPVPSAS